MSCFEDEFYDYDEIDLSGGYEDDDEDVPEDPYYDQAEIDAENAYLDSRRWDED